MSSSCMLASLIACLSDEFSFSISPINVLSTSLAFSICLSLISNAAFSSLSTFNWWFFAISFAAITIAACSLADKVLPSFFAFSNSEVTMSCAYCFSSFGTYTFSFFTAPNLFLSSMSFVLYAESSWPCNITSSSFFVLLVALIFVEKSSNVEKSLFESCFVYLFFIPEIFFSISESFSSAKAISAPVDFGSLFIALYFCISKLAA